MNLNELKERKVALGYTNAMIAERSGVPLGTVQKIFSGATSHPRYETLTALERVLAPAGNARRPEGADLSASGSLVREEAYAYGADTSGERWPRQGSYTLKDYYALPEDVRVELIDGVFYDMTAPAVRHQAVLGELHILFRECIDSHHKDCKVFFAPLDVRLDRDNRTMVQPDLLVLCHENDDPRRLEGAPELALEILSPSTRRKDCFLKLNKYMHAGVKEYWIVDPGKEKVLVYHFEDDSFPLQYSFEDQIPIGLSGGECEIDMKRVKAAL